MMELPQGIQFMKELAQQVVEQEFSHWNILPVVLVKQMMWKIF
jgi:hypothetical protein